VFATFPAYIAVVRAIIGDRTGYLLASASGLSSSRPSHHVHAGSHCFAVLQ
jgi:hypothetical protein